MPLWYTLAGSAAKGLFSLLPRLGGKAGKWQAGQRGIWEKLRDFKQRYPERPLWFHCASLGEFEQAKPVLLALRERYPGVPVVVTLFSPSGYEARKGFGQAELVSYLPLDGGGNAARWVRELNPRAVFWVKYEFWLGYLRAVKKADIPLYLLAALPKEKYFTGVAAGYYRQALGSFDKLFLQWEEEGRLLPDTLKAKAVPVGDPRYDNVLAGRAVLEPVPELVAFRAGSAKPLLLVGSAWQADMEVLLPALEALGNPFRLMVFPHEMHGDFLAYLREKCPVGVSFWSEGVDFGAETLVVDKVGMLFRAYHECDVAWVGGGFGSGLHNILEAAVWGKPVLYGPKIEHFPEAGRLAKAGGGFTIVDSEEAGRILKKLLDKPAYAAAAEAARRFVESHAGATGRILAQVDIGL